ncbi:MAG: 4-(cytidine 5'-diphospho)-2-C-methyl-D-erythritol kinase [Magnetospiraceae bacterium]
MSKKISGRKSSKAWWQAGARAITANGLHTEAAPAKVNLFLHVTGRRDDGYHLIDSLVVFVDVCDLLFVQPTETAITLALQGPQAINLEAPEDNLVTRAARALRAATGGTRGAAITLEKHLPIAAGIGGGSADAAAALRVLTRLWHLNLSPERMRELALGLGADVPVCLESRPRFMGGIGERLTATPTLPPCWLVLVNPGVRLSTPMVFAAREGAFSEAGRFTGTVPDARSLAARLADTRNDLQEPAMRLAPEVRTVLDACAALPDCLLARMSGSGATCFALFENREPAEAAAHQLAQRFGWWAAAAPIL